MALQPINYSSAFAQRDALTEAGRFNQLGLQGLQLQQARQQMGAQQAQQAAQQAFQQELQQLDFANPGAVQEFARRNPQFIEETKRYSEFQDAKQKEAVGNAAQDMYRAVQMGDPAEISAAIDRNAQVINATGDPSFSADRMKSIAQQNPELFKQMMEGTLKTVGLGDIVAGGRGYMPAGEREFESLTQDFTEDEKRQARRIKAGLLPRATGSAAQTISELGNVKRVAQTEEQLAAGKEAGKLSSQLKLKPAIRGEVELAAKGAAALADKAKEERSNQATFDVYETAMSGLYEALGGTETGPFVGRLPALTADQQTADGAVAAMAPVLKQLFRASGEGVFTDKDQELLMRMVPTRADTEAARLSKMQNIDAIVRAKLGVPQEQQPAQQEPTLDELLQKYGG